MREGEREREIKEREEETERERGVKEEESDETKRENEGKDRKLKLLNKPHIVEMVSGVRIFFFFSFHFSLVIQLDGIGCIWCLGL